MKEPVRKVYSHSRWPNHFIAGIGTFAGGVLALDDPDLQELLEQHPGFGREIKFIGNDVPAPKAAEAPLPVPPGASGRGSKPGQPIQGAISSDRING